MSAVLFDTLKFAKRLKEAGFTEQQAEALISANVALIELFKRLIDAGFPAQQACGYVEATADALRQASERGHL